MTYENESPPTPTLFGLVLMRLREKSARRENEWINLAKERVSGGRRFDGDENVLITMN